mmetsp:Transcript_127719/g.180208  ORF Transcript_127719/g.180208 Transcript_127719/m.180208 type:complete len:88 (-) Transcript_127719:210-473(-)
MKDYLYGFEVDEAAAGKMDQGSAPGVLHRVTIPLDGGKVGSPFPYPINSSRLVNVDERDQPALCTSAHEHSIVVGFVGSRNDRLWQG